MSNKITTKELFEHIQNTLIKGHTHIVKIFNDREESIDYIRDKQLPAAELLFKIFNEHTKSEESTNQLVIDLVIQISAYKSILEIVMKDKNPYEQLHKLFTQLNKAYEDIRKIIESN